MIKKVVQDYYDYTVPMYRLLWHRDANAVHYGIWDKDIKSLKEALLNTNNIVSKLLKITPENKILDAGCGIGGSSVWIAKNTGAKVVGITISPQQLKQANKLAEKMGVSDLTNFQIMDYTKTSFNNNEFDAVFAIESVCHANPKIDFLKEAYRILKPGGRIAVVDGFIYRDPKDNVEIKWLADFYEGMALECLDKVPEFLEAARKVGYKNIKFIDKTHEIMPSSKIIHDMCLWGYPGSVILEKLRLFPHLMTTNCRAGLVQYNSMLAGMGCYGIFYAEK